MASLIEEAGEDSRKQSKARKIELESSECGQTQFAESRTKFVIVAANNHYAGFGPATANSFRKMLGLKETV
jgi:hypothetical protein